MISRIIFAAIFLSHLGYAFAGNDNKAISTAKKMLEQHLTDPASVQYRNIKVVYTDNNPKNKAFAVCFEYNSKNRMGGYVGFEKEICTLDKDGKCWGIDLELTIMREFEIQEAKDSYRGSMEPIIEIFRSKNCDGN